MVKESVIDSALRRFVGSRLRAARLELEMRQEEAAAALGMSQDYLSLIETAKRPVRADDLYHLARLYGKPMNYFFPEEDQRSMHPVRADVEQSILFWANDEQYYGERARYQSPSNLPPDQALISALGTQLNARIVEVLPRMILLSMPLLELMPLAKDCIGRNIQNKLGFLLEVLDRLRPLSDRHGPKDRAYWLLIHKTLTMLQQNRLQRDDAFCGLPPIGKLKEQLLLRLPDFCRAWRILENWQLNIFERHLKQTR